MEITEKVAYLKGLLEGMKIDTEKNEGKILAAVIDVLEDIGLELQDMWEAQNELEDGLDVVSDDLEDVENLLYDEEDDEDGDDGEDLFKDLHDDSDDEDACYATTCPSCQKTIYFDETVLAEGEIRCPNCGEKLEFDFSDQDDEDQDPDGPPEA